MATIYFRGDAALRTQVGTFQITSVDATPANTTYQISIGTRSVSVVGDTDVNTTATNLQVALAAATHPYFTAVTWTVATDTITATAAVSGAPFSAGSVDTGGSGTIGAYSVTTANGGPSDIADTRNWLSNVIPVANSDVVIRDISTNICWGLNSLSNALDSFVLYDTYTGKIGLDWARFATSADGATYDTSVIEYREPAFQITVTQADGAIELGKRRGPAIGAGSTRIVLATGISAHDIIIYSTAATSAEPGRPVVRLRPQHASVNIFIENAPGGVGFPADKPGQTCEFGKLSVAGVNTRVSIEETCTAGEIEQREGAIVIHAGGDQDISPIVVAGGTFRTEGYMKCTSFTNNGGACTLNHNPSATDGGVAITTANLNHGTTDATKSTRPRTWTTVNWDPKNASLEYDDAVLTITNANFVQNDTEGRL